MKVFKGAILFIWDIAKIVLISLAIIVPIRAFIIQPFTVRGASMHPAFETGDYLFVNEIGYRFSKPKRGDVIIFRPPQNTSQFYIKRIIGLPGESVKVEDGRVWVGKDASLLSLLNEEYIKGLTPGRAQKDLGDNEYFVLGDNRDASSDSRNWGSLTRKGIIGKAWIRAWPLNRFKVIGGPEY